MNLGTMFKKNNYITVGGKRESRPEVPDGLLKQCNKCKAAIYTSEVISNHYICPKCKGYFRLPVNKRIEMITEPGSFDSWDEGMEVCNPLGFKGYEEKVIELQEKTGLEEAVITGSAFIGNNKVALAVCDGRFMMASMGHVVGEKITRVFERATSEGLPVIVFACSGGARMQEGMISLMQMAKTAAAVKKHGDAGNLYVTVLTDPTTGGVTASYAMLGDIILAEPGALIGFAGPRVIEQTIGQKLPEGFQRAEFQVEHGFADAIVTRDNMKNTLLDILRLHKVKRMREGMPDTFVPTSFEQKADAWERVILSRKKDRPTGMDYIRELFPDFIELHGDRYFGDDPAIVGGIAEFLGVPVTVIVQCKGRNTKENIKRNFGMPSPEGYRKVLRLMKQAEKFKRPVICLVDTPGAFCGMEAEERGQGEAIARNLLEMSALKTPILSVVIGEGGSGGALAMAVADQVWMLENAIYSILSPEGFASILWKDSKRAKEAAEVMKITSHDLKKLQIVDGIILEPKEYTRENMGLVIEQLEELLGKFLSECGKKDMDELLQERYERFRKF
ncbi:MAG: acetyl-CoA carboxylase carboxyltransferase subunit alpha [Lachnospiraceae bacterium]|nr:acetyl-CoA carboxylase carboxyltransferase subunit alpha [Lachnospiraceae bacterium]